ncbi:MAG: hypothetical protein J4F36_13665 [Nitrosopumilaceae archaeon]|nr:hypothetical protein [Nitrosopumilaceae archaeon]
MFNVTDIFPTTLTLHVNSDDEIDPPVAFSDALLSLGLNILIWTLTDTSGNLSIAYELAYIEDTTPPVVTAPADYTVALPQNQTSISLNSTDYGIATATDIFDVTITNNAPLSFSHGVTTIIWNAIDYSNNTSTANQTVTVNP